ncbi:helix-turn-helix transcriptional regulator [Gloeobacter kilaueensis]|uniref:Transcriptional regulator n=1 Tax=Gloeobacter kilaueensis (strain ATCC BAA-2537 / CCAP 1431/1 / ULC 316 / JS1) TaxID=1183438 RepID=U5QFF0_GLOK1|nr:WYL domain-containing protein [Gloeobacter kilaueensis]AGY56314.1 transcriptional regulator [Gloeobacter kilaueensis JS1]
MADDLSLEDLDRLLRIDRLIRLGQARSTMQLARALAASPPAIQRALLKLRDSYGAPLVVDRVRGYIYKEPGWKLPPLPFTLGELFVLLAGNRILAESEGTLHTAEVRAAIDQLVHQLPSRRWIDLETLRDYLHVEATSRIASFSYEVWTQLYETFESGLQAFVDYAPPGEPPVSRLVNPYLLYIWRGHTPYLIGYDLGSKKFEVLRADRIRSIRARGERFERDPAFDPAPLIAQIAEEQAGTLTTPVSILFSPKAIATLQGRLLHPSQQISLLPDGSLRLQLKVADLNEIKRWVLSFGSEATVEEPRALVEQIQSDLRQLAARYGLGQEVAKKSSVGS